MRPTFAGALVLLMTALSPALQAVNLPGRVLRVIDGDTLILDVGGGQYRVEIAGIDAPELNQPWGEVASSTLARRLTGTFVVVDAAEIDGYRVRGGLQVQNRDIALDLLYAGLAWSTVQYEPPLSQLSDQERLAHPYVRAETEARIDRRGVWSDPQPVPPWIWRLWGGMPPAQQPQQ
ncbi:MAG: thermonuclease family protein [Gammaproteobacteria bacterium]|nr:thermonuclease family protein [Gammaproteobacteria bacterium]